LSGGKPPAAFPARPSLRERKAPTLKPVGSANDCLRRAVLARLIADPLVSTGHIRVVAVAGVVTLSGYVTSNAQKDAASAVARRIKGVELVADHLKVALPCAAKANAPAEPSETKPPAATAYPPMAFASPQISESGVEQSELRP